jgi:predicted  nucleic acid-binding Zn-ribbon protein
MDFVEQLKDRVTELEQERIMLTNEIFRLNELLKDMERQIYTSSDESDLEF